MKTIRPRSLLPLPKLHAKAWRLFSEYVRRKDNGVCYTCSKVDHWTRMDAGHFIHKNCLDFDPRNVHSQCTRCNRFLHGNLGNYAIRLTKEYGLDVVEELTLLGHQIRKFNRGELEHIIDSYQTVLKEMRTNG